MKIIKIKDNIVCDMAGCGKIADCEIKFNQDADGLKFCKFCLKDIHYELDKIYKK